MKVKRPSIADFIRPLREAKERERDRELEREKGTWADANISTDATTTEGSAATSHHLAGGTRGTAAPANMLTTTMLPSDSAPSRGSSASSQEDKALFSSPQSVPVESTERDRPGKERGAGLFSGQRRVQMTKRLLREGKSQSLILLTGPDPEGPEHCDSKVRT